MNRIGTGWETVFGFSLYAPLHLALLQVPHPCRCMYKMLFFDSEMCTLQKVGGEDSKGRRVL